jgi:hypothetical protein
VENSLRLLQMSAVLAECLHFEKKPNQKLNGKNTSNPHHIGEK